MGAPDPRTGPAATVEVRQIDVAAGRNHWAYRRPANPTIPEPKDAAWVRNDIDRFIRARQESANVVPNAEASRETLLRRVSFDLVGLPPTPEELRDFLADDSPTTRRRRTRRSWTGCWPAPGSASDGPGIGSR